MTLVAGLRDRVGDPDPRVLDDARAALMQHATSAPARRPGRFASLPRRPLPLAAALAAGAAAITAIVLGLSLAGPPGAQAKLTAWSVRSNPDGTVTVRFGLGTLYDQAGLQRALGNAGIPAVIHSGVECEPASGGMTQREARELSQVMKYDTGTAPSTVVITPAAIPEGAELYISILKAKGLGSLAETLLLPRGTAVTCHAKNIRGPLGGIGG